MTKLTFGPLPRVLVALSLPLTVGCAAAPIDGSDEDVAEAREDGKIASTSQALNLGRGFWSWEDNTDSSADLGASGAQTCFLSGVGGFLGGGLSTGETRWYSEAGAYLANNRYYIKAHGNVLDGNLFGGWVRATVICVGTATNRYRASWSKGQSRRWLGAASANRHCFVESVHGGLNAFTTNNDRIMVTQEDGNWYLDGVGDSYYANDIGGSAVCFDAPPGGGVGDWSWYLSGTNDSITHNIMTETTAAACGLTGVRGRFTGTYDGDDGVHILWPSASPGTWRLKLENGPSAGSSYHRGYLRCIE